MTARLKKIQATASRLAHKEFGPLPTLEQLERGEVSYEHERLIYRAIGAFITGYMRGYKRAQAASYFRGKKNVKKSA